MKRVNYWSRKIHVAQKLFYYICSKLPTKTLAVSLKVAASICRGFLSICDLLEDTRHQKVNFQHICQLLMKCFYYRF